MTAPTPIVVRSLARPFGEELSVAATLSHGTTPAELARQVSKLLEERSARVLVAEVFGAPAFCAEFSRDARWPVLAVGDAAQPPELSGVLVTALVGAPVEPLEVEGRVVGSVWTDSGARLCRLAGVGPVAPGRDAAEETRQTFALMERALEQAGVSFADVVRTWFYNRDILGWYREFNAVRTAFFTERGVFDRLVPASTGIGTSNARGTALHTGLLAVRRSGEAGRVQALASPLQCPAPAYGSSFSRAVELTFPGLRRVLVSGTASIQPGGASAHVGDFDAQVEVTMRVVEGILASRGARWSDVVRGVAYLRRAEDLEAWHRHQQRWLPGAPIVTSRDVVCREELLFELEVDAAVVG